MPKSPLFLPKKSTKYIVGICDKKARAAYEEDLCRNPNYPRGNPRRKWEDLDWESRETWIRNPEMRKENLNMKN